MANCFGIHLGNSSISIALSKDSKNEVIANDSGDRVTPAVAIFNGSDLDIGIPLKGSSRRKCIISNNKRLFNKEILPEEIDLLNDRNDCKIKCEDGVLYYEVQLDNNIIKLTPKDIISKFYTKMFSIATHAACAEGDLQTVISIPLHWSEENQQQLVEAAEVVGFNILQVISEPAAAMLAYDFDESIGEQYVLIYRLGGSSCDISLMKVINGVFNLENSTRQTGIGGQYITKDLTNYIAREFFQKWKLDPQENKRAMEKLFHQANDCKHILSTLNSAHIFIESLYEGIDWSQNISRARFENVISSKLEACIEPLKKFLNEIEPEKKICKVILSGGSMKIPKLQNIISDLLPNATILNNLSADQVIALGCAKQADLLTKYSDISLENKSGIIDCITSSIYVKYMNKKICLFPSGSPVYSEIEYPFIFEKNDLNTIDLKLYEDGEFEKHLGDFSFPFYPAKSKIYAILNDNDFILNVI